MTQARRDKISQVHVRINMFITHDYGALFAMERYDPAATDITAVLQPGMFVRNPAAPEWGLGQVQSNIAAKVTVNFENEGKVVLDGRKIALIIVDPS
jgi:hypothetical protein